MVAGVDLYEPQFLALFVFGGFVILSTIVYLVSAFSMQEKSYEDAIAEQRARMEKEQQLNVKDGSKPRKKYPRKKKDRERTENHQAHAPPPPEEILPPEKVEEEVHVEEAPPARPPPKAKSPKSKKEKKKENKEAAAANKAQESPKAPPPVEEVIVPKVQQEVKSAPPPKPAKEKRQKVVEEPILIQKEMTSHAAPPPRVEQVHHQKEEPTSSPNKAKKNKGTASGDTDGTSVRSLIAGLRSAKLSDGDVQKIVEILHQKHPGSTQAEDWIKANQRSDPIAGLKKQLQEKEQALHNEILLAQSSAQKVKEIRAELVQEKSRGNQIEDHYKKKVEAQQRDVDAMHIRMRQTHEAHAHENQALQSRVKQLQGINNEANIEAVKQLQEENARLKTEANHAAQQKEQIMGAELGRLQNELQKMQGQMAAKDAHVRQSDEIRRNLEAKTAQYEQQIKQAGSRENENALSKRLSEVSEELRKAESRSLTLAHDLEQSNKTLSAITQERDGITQQIQEFLKKEAQSKNAVSSLEVKLKESTAQKQNLEGRVRTAETKLSEEEKLRLKKAEELQTLQGDRAKLESQVQQLNKKVEEQVQKSSAPNGDLTDQGSKSKEKMILVTEHEQMLGDKAKTIDALQKQLETSKSEADKLKKDAEKQMKKNNDLREKKLESDGSTISNGKSVMDKVDKAVKSVKDGIQADLVQEQQLAKASLQRIFPAVQIDNKLSHKDWVAQFEKSAAQVLKEVSSSSQVKVNELSSKLSTVEEEKEKLSTQCQHYQSVLSETEGVLNKLQSSVESEAKKWQEKLKLTENSLAQSKRENATLKEDLKKKGGNEKAVEENQRLTKELAAAKARAVEQEKAHAAAAKEYDTSCKELAGVKQQLTQLQKALEAATQKAEKENSAGNAEVFVLKKQLVAEQAKVKQLSGDLDKAKQASAANEKEANAKKGKEAEIHKDMESTKKALAETTQKLDKLQNDMGSQIKGLQSELEKTKTEKAELEKSSGQLKEKDQKLEEKDKELTTMKAALAKEKGLTKDLGTAAGKLQAALKKMQQALMEEKQTTAKLKAAQVAPKEVAPKAEVKAEVKAEAKAEEKAEVGGSAV
ncbi:ribosome-binding protein 1-like isoform X2 [Amphiura filiformis]|uniref:ribosome-binding protein 1-like isoform X2 n=1 Tax=Amphiura filiformis TaxID=82378 RepID=UPI003B21B84D